MSFVSFSLAVIFIIFKHTFVQNIENAVQTCQASKSTFHCQIPQVRSPGQFCLKNNTLLQSHL